MELGFGPEFDSYRDEVREFLAAHWPPADGELTSSANQRAFVQAAVENGYLHRSVPRRFGGSEEEPDIVRAEIIREEFYRARAPNGNIAVTGKLVVPTLLECGSEAQWAQLIPKTLTGEIRWAQGFSEPNAGSDLASLRTRAELVVGDQRPEDLEHRRPSGDPHVRSGSHRAGHAYARWHLVSVGRSPPARRHDSAPDPDDRAEGILRGLLRRRADAGGHVGRRARQGLVRDALDVEARTIRSRRTDVAAVDVQRLAESGAHCRAQWPARDQRSTGYMAQFIAKGDGIVARIALTLQHLDWCYSERGRDLAGNLCPETPPPAEISADAVRRAALRGVSGADVRAVHRLRFAIEGRT